MLKIFRVVCEVASENASILHFIFLSLNYIFSITVTFIAKNYVCFQI